MRKIKYVKIKNNSKSNKKLIDIYRYILRIKE